MVSGWVIRLGRLPGPIVVGRGSFTEDITKSLTAIESQAWQG